MSRLCELTCASAYVGEHHADEAVVVDDFGVVRSAVATADQHIDDFVNHSTAVDLDTPFG